jgi:precorrin-3B C17-methyltransferase
MHDSPHGTLFLVGLGPGPAALITPEAAAALEAAEVVVGYRGYLDLIAERLGGKRVVGRELGQEVERATEALELAEAGRTVALVSSGDAGVYGMAGVALELAARRGTSTEVVVVPGVTAALSAAARLGAPLAHDWACISLSDLLTPWETIVRRVEAAVQADFVIALYNPSSRARRRHLPAVAEILLRHRDPATPVGLVENAYRAGERVEITRLDALATAGVSMFTTVVVGSSTTFVTGGRMVTPRIYEAKAEDRGPRDVGRPGAAEDDPTSIVPLGSGPGWLWRSGATPRRPDAPGRRGVEDSATATQLRGLRPGAATTGEAIMAESLAIIDRELGPEPAEPRERAVVRRMIHATADFDHAANVRFGPGLVEAAVSALRAGAPIVVDVEMLRAGIRRDLTGPLGVEAICGLGDPGIELSTDPGGPTRSALGLRRAAERVGDGAIVAIGNAPTALMEAIRMVEERGWRLAAIVGIPVGFVGVEEAKRRLIEQGRVPYLTSLGRKGGSAVTAAAVNALLELAGARV